MLRFPGAGVQHARARRQFRRQLPHRVFNGCLEVEDVAVHPPGKPALDGGVLHDFFRASMITVEPARQAASRTVNGRHAITSTKYNKSLASFANTHSRKPR